MPRGLKTARLTLGGNCTTLVVELTSTKPAQGVSLALFWSSNDPHGCEFLGLVSAEVQRQLAAIMGDTKLAVS